MNFTVSNDWTYDCYILSTMFINYLAVIVFVTMGFFTHSDTRIPILIYLNSSTVNSSTFRTLLSPLMVIRRHSKLPMTSTGHGSGFIFINIYKVIIQVSVSMNFFKIFLYLFGSSFRAIPFTRFTWFFSITTRMFHVSGFIWSGPTTYNARILYLSSTYTSCHLNVLLG